MTARLPDIRLQRCAEKIHALGPRPLFEMLKEIRRGTNFEDVIEIYSGVDLNIIRALGGDRFPPRLILIEGGKQ